MPVVSVAYSNRTFTPSRIHRPSTHLLDQQGRARSNRVRTKSQEKSKKQKAGATHPHRRLGSETVREVSICNFACTLLRFGESARLFSLLVSAYANDDETIGSPFCAYRTLRMEPAAFSRCRFPRGCAQLSEELSSSQSGNAGHVSVQLIGRIWNRNPVSDWLVQGLRGPGHYSAHTAFAVSPHRQRPTRQRNRCDERSRSARLVGDIKTNENRRVFRDRRRGAKSENWSDTTTSNGASARAPPGPPFVYDWLHYLGTLFRLFSHQSRPHTTGESGSHNVTFIRPSVRPFS